jgi:hypothetical protein
MHFSGGFNAVLFRPFRSLASFALVSLLIGGVTVQALAAGAKDKEAQKLLTQAMDEDYLSVEFDKAEKKLTDALKKCGDSGCSPALVGKVNMALGTVYGASSKFDLAKDAFVAALKADPNAALDSALSTPELEKAFKAAQAMAGAGGGTDEPAEDEPVKPKKKSKAPGGDIAHTPVPEQVVNTPVPVYIEIPEEYGAEKATLKYKPFGGTSWKTLTLKKIGDGFGAEIPCDDVTTTGDLKYYIVVIDESGEPAGQAGSLKAPYKVTIKNEIDSESPSLPGKKPPSQCMAKEDCPPGLPGCPDKKSGGKRGDKDWGASCETSSECKAEFICMNGSCETGTEEGDSKSSSSSAKKNVIGLSIGLDLMLISGSDAVCSGTDPSYVCFQRDSNKQFYGKPAAIDQTNAINGGFGVAGARVMLSYDRLLSEKLGLGLGARIGFAFGGQPSRDEGTKPFRGAPQGDALGFLPLHLEGRLAYSFGNPLFEQKKLRPFIFLGGGVAQVSGSVPVDICNTVDAKGKAAIPDTAGKCKGKGHKELVDAYQVTGLGFVGLGGGAVYGITSNFGVSAELKMMFMLPTFGVIFEPTIGPVFAF